MISNAHQRFIVDSISHTWLFLHVGAVAYHRLRQFMIRIYTIRNKISN
jgi:hypothetical protein